MPICRRRGHARSCTGAVAFRLHGTQDLSLPISVSLVAGADRKWAAYRGEAPPERPLTPVTALHEVIEGQVIAIDGKTLRRSFDAASRKSAIHMVSAWATANHISLGQTVVDAKSNEITAIPKLLEMLETAGSLVTIDAMGCQTEIAQKIIDAKSDYVLAVK